MRVLPLVAALTAVATVSILASPASDRAMVLIGFGFPQLAVEMPAFAEDNRLGPSEIEDLVDYVLALSHRDADPQAVERAVRNYEQHCQVCHGPGGEGAPKAGAPDLTDDAWRWGSTRSDIREQIWRGDDGRGPPRQAAHHRGWGV